MITEYQNEIKDDEPLPGDDLGLNEAPSQGVKILTNELKDDEILAETTTTLKGVSTQTYIPNETGGLQTSAIISPGDFVPNTDEKVKNYFTTIIPLLLETGTDDTLAGWTRSNGAANDSISGGGLATFFNTNGSPRWTTPIPGSTSGQYYIFSDGKILRIKYYALHAPQQADDVSAVGIVSSTDIALTNADETSVARAIRFIAVDATGNLWAVNGNNVANTRTEIIGVNLLQWHIFEIVFEPTVSAKFYVDGVLKATHTTNLPTEGGGVYVNLSVGINDSNAAAGCYLWISPITISWEL